MYHHESLSQREIARKSNHSRKTIKKALEHSAPPGYRRSQPAEHHVLDPFIPIIEWPQVFGDERVTGSLLDRLTHRVNILEINGDSYRLKSSLKRREKKGGATKKKRKG